jgi:hypothetical protein
LLDRGFGRHKRRGATAHGELHAEAWAPVHVTVTPSSGIGAGEQILDWLLTQVRVGLTR